MDQLTAASFRLSWPDLWTFSRISWLEDFVRLY